MTDIYSEYSVVEKFIDDEKYTEAIKGLEKIVATDESHR